MSALGGVCDRTIPTLSKAKWSFKSRAVATVYKNQGKTVQFCDELEQGWANFLAGGPHRPFKGGRGPGLVGSYSCML